MNRQNWRRKSDNSNNEEQPFQTQRDENCDACGASWVVCRI
jgi:hypothetical protein